MAIMKKEEKRKLHLVECLLQVKTMLRINIALVIILETL